jgi:cytochrome c peroxidase
MKSIRLIVVLGAAALAAVLGGRLLIAGEKSEGRASGAQILPPGYGALQFTAPEPGSYSLPPMGMAVDGEVLDSSGRSLRLFDLFEGKIVLLSFIYSTCTDVGGCPLATAVLHKVQRRLRDEPSLRDRLRLVTISFNPAHDTPEVMRAYGAGFQGAGVDWRFLTTASEQVLQPILDGYNQSVQKEVNVEGASTGAFSHILRVFLIDRQKRIRNVYSVSFLHPDTLINDVKTLLLEEVAESPTASAARGMKAGESREAAVAASAYVTDTTALATRSGKAADLLQWIDQPPLGLPPVPVPDENPVSREKIALGRRLFYDRRLSLNDTVSCAMCHVPEQGFTSNELATSVGIEGRTVRRNAPTIYNTAYLTRLFHDGREYSLEQQVWGPLLARNEMGNPSVGYVVEKIKRLPDYKGLFEQAFGRGPTMETIGMAIANYERALNSANSPFDRWYYGHQADALTDKAQRGFQLFTGKAGCVACHAVGSESALLMDNGLHNTGIGYRASMFKEPETRTIEVAPGLSLEVDAAAVEAVSEHAPNDLGLYEITQDPSDRWKYRTPSLRNVALTAPYMHDGSLATLEEVVQFYNQGGEPNENLDARIKPLGLTAAEVDDLVAFLNALTGDNVGELVADALAAPVGDPN